MKEYEKPKVISGNASVNLVPAAMAAAAATLANPAMIGAAAGLGMNKLFGRDTEDFIYIQTLKKVEQMA